LLFGSCSVDFTGGGAVIVAARGVLQTAYSRHRGSTADEFAARLIYKVGGDPHAAWRHLVTHVPVRLP